MLYLLRLLLHQLLQPSQLSACMLQFSFQLFSPLSIFSELLSFTLQCTELAFQSCDHSRGICYGEAVLPQHAAVVAVLKRPDLQNAGVGMKHRMHHCLVC